MTDEMIDEDDTADQTSSVLVRSILAGVVFGTAANIIALCLGYSFLTTLLCHTVFGLLGMALAFVGGLIGRSPQKVRPPQPSALIKD